MQQILEKADKLIVDNKRIVGGLALLSATYLTTKVVGSLFGLVRRQLIPGHNLIERYGKGSYAVISACTDGIGKGFALELAKRGFNIVMLIRNAQKGQALAEEIRTTINKDIDIRIVEIDFQKILTQGVVEAAIEQIKDLDISILVNNVGMYLNNASFETQTSTELLNMISMNIASQVLLTRHLIGQIKSRKQKGAIINLSSVTSLCPLAGFAVYGAAKTFNDYFSRAIGEEYKSQLDVLSVKPGWVATPMTNGFKKKQLEISPEQCADGALRQLGRAEVTHGHFYHELAGLKEIFIAGSTNKIMRGYTAYLLSQYKAQQKQQQQS